ncbi:MAG: hypothetical protein SVU88_00400 [Candidatus Nanohaloarchaea archaeon]|nr:hypothetical protein [Candidatus Nanohaloarchaea archaeon]
MSSGILVETVALVFAAVNIMLLLSILSRLTSVDETPRAWNFLMTGMSLVIISFSIEVFISVNRYFDFAAMHLLSGAASLLGFGFLFGGVRRIWRVMYQ